MWKLTGRHSLRMSPNAFFFASVYFIYCRYLDGWHYCTKNLWFENSADDYPAPFNKFFHLEMGVKLGGGGGLEQDFPSGGVDMSALPQEMLVDYVRITQARSHTCSSWCAE